MALAMANMRPTSSDLRPCCKLRPFFSLRLETRVLSEFYKLILPYFCKFVTNKTVGNQRAQVQTILYLRPSMLTCTTKGRGQEASICKPATNVFGAPPGITSENFKDFIPTTLDRANMEDFAITIQDHGLVAVLRQGTFRSQHNIRRQCFGATYLLNPATRSSGAS